MELIARYLKSRTRIRGFEITSMLMSYSEVNSVVLQFVQAVALEVVRNKFVLDPLLSFVETVEIALLDIN